MLASTPHPDQPIAALGELASHPQTPHVLLSVRFTDGDDGHGVAPAYPGVTLSLIAPGTRSDRQLRSGRFLTDSITSSALVEPAGFNPQLDSRSPVCHAPVGGWAGVPAGFYDIPKPAHGAMDVTV